MHVAAMPCSLYEGPENVFDGQIRGGDGSVRAATEPYTWPALVSYHFLQLTLDREYR